MSRPTFTISIDSKKLREGLNELRGRGLHRNMTNVVNKLAFDGTAALRDEMKRVFKNPTNWTLNSFKVIKARPFRTDAAIATRDIAPGYDRGSAAARYLSPDVLGDQRGMKPSEHALSELSGKQFWVPGRDAPLDANGNIKASEIGRILSHLSLHDDPGKNLSDQAAARLRRRTQRRGPKNANGQRGSYFVGRAENGHAVGVYKYSGTPGKILEIIRFVPVLPRYHKILPAQQIVSQVIERRARHHVEQEIAIRARKKAEGKS